MYAKNQFLPYLRFDLKFLDRPKSDGMLKPIFRQVPNIRKAFEEIVKSELTISEVKLNLKLNLENKFILLGVAFGWGKRKGLDVFIELSKRLPDDYQIVLVGTNENIDQLLPSNIISIQEKETLPSIFAIEKEKINNAFTIVDSVVKIVNIHSFIP